jgi:hypothetical protein
LAAVNNRDSLLTPEAKTVKANKWRTSRQETAAQAKLKVPPAEAWFPIEMRVQAISDDTKRTIRKAVDEFWQYKNFQQFICACCDESFHHNDIEEKLPLVFEEKGNYASDLACLKKRLPWMDSAVSEVRRYYSSSIIERISEACQNLILHMDNASFLQQFIIDIEHIALSSYGIELKITGNKVAIQINYCKPCHKALFSNKFTGPPKFSLANGWAIGAVPPELSKLTQAEVRMVTKAPVTGIIHLIGREGAGRGVLRTHMMAWNSVPQPAAMQVNR